MQDRNLDYIHRSDVSLFFGPFDGKRYEVNLMVTGHRRLSTSAPEAQLSFCLQLTTLQSSFDSDHSVQKRLWKGFYS